MYRPDICIYHGGCMDGFTAAWVVSTRYNDRSIVFAPAIYNQPPPPREVYEGKHLLIVDFSYPKLVLEGMSIWAKSITILDHHKTAQRALEEFAIFNPVTRDTIEEVLTATQPGLGNVRAVFDMSKSGARLTYDFCNSEWTTTRKLVDYVGDRDLWRHELPYTKEINAAISSYDFTFDNWHSLHACINSQQGFTTMIAEGAAIRRKEQKDIREMLKVNRRMMKIGEHIICVANLPYNWASEAAHIMAEESGFGHAACYFDRADGKRQFSLRSVGDFDVSEVAKRYGGGGHKNAAGFEAATGWEGESWA